MSSYASIVEFTDVKGNPKVHMALPGPLLLGTKLILNTVLRRKNGNRVEELRIHGEFKVTSSAIDARGPARQVVSVEATKVTPVWISVKTPHIPKRKPPPAIAPRTVIA